MSVFTRHKIILSIIVGLLYAALTVILSPISYGPIQFRIAEALCILPFFFPCTMWGITIGCLIANIAGSYGIPDIVFGTLATFVSCIIIYWLGQVNPRSWIRTIVACFIPVIINAWIISIVISYTELGSFTSRIFSSTMFMYMSFIFFGEAVVMFALGLPLIRNFPKSKLFSRICNLIR